MMGRKGRILKKAHPIDLIKEASKHGREERRLQRNKSVGRLVLGAAMTRFPIQNERVYGIIK